MKEIYTEIEINSSKEKVWEKFTNFDNYSEWNPFITLLNGTVKKGNRISVVINPPDANKMVFKPTITEYIEQKKLEWLGHLIIPGLFDGRHNFEIVDFGGKVKFIQKEQFKGLLVPLFAKMLDNNTKRGFEQMNEKLKELCEKD